LSGHALNLKQQNKTSETKPNKTSENTKMREITETNKQAKGNENR
jgi:hypothetical protein